jgi:hypothetical protein
VPEKGGLTIPAEDWTWSDTTMVQYEGATAPTPPAALAKAGAVFIAARGL